MHEFGMFAIPWVVTFIAFFVTAGVIIEEGDKRWLFLAIGLPVVLWIVFMGWRGFALYEFNKDGGHLETYSTVVEVTDKPIKNGGAIQVIDFWCEGEVHIVNITKIFGKILKERTKIKVSKYETYRVSGGIGFVNNGNSDLKYEIVEGD